MTAFRFAVGEQDFHIPSARSHLAGHDCRRNLTDAQETAQWVSGRGLHGEDSGGIVGPLGLLEKFLHFCPPTCFEVWCGGKLIRVSGP